MLVTCNKDTVKVYKSVKVSPYIFFVVTYILLLQTRKCFINLCDKKFICEKYILLTFLEPSAWIGMQVLYLCVCELVTSQWLSAELCSVQYSSLSLCVPCLWFSISCFTSAEPTPSGALIYDWGSSYNLPSRVQTSAALPSSLPGFILSPVLCRELIIVSFSMHCWTGLQLNPVWYIQLLSLSCDMYSFLWCYF